MTYQQAGRIAVLKRILGWVIFIPALISTLISLLKFMNTRQENKEGINAVMLDFTHVMIDMMQANTPFLNLFWYNSPTPNFNGGVNVMFWVIFILIFVGLALQDSGARMSRQARFLREGVEDQLILEKAKGEEGLTREQIESRIVVPHHTIFLQFFSLYILPVICIAAGYVLMNPLMILVKIIKLRWIHILSYDQMVSRKINNQTTRCANSIFYTTLFTNSAPNYT
ncbi:hypothetical protein TUM2805_20010 [Escherichia coli]|nr:hypothetical protein TUM2805_20010 [Escherichia coli]